MILIFDILSQYFGRIVLKVFLLFRIQLIICLLMSIAVTATGQPVVVKEDVREYSIGPHLEVLEDKNGNWSIENVTSTELSSKFARNVQKNPDYGEFTNSVYWVRFDISNPLQKVVLWYLEIDYPTLENIDLYVPDGHGNYRKKTADDLYKLKDWEIKHRNILFQLEEQPLSRKTYYLRFKSSTVSLQLTLRHFDTLRTKIANKQIAHGLYLGTLLVMLLLNLFLFVFKRESAYLYYVLFILGFFLAEAILTGIAFQYFRPEKTWWISHSLAFSGGFSMFWIIQFTRKYLNLRRYNPLLDNVFLVALAVIFVELVVVFLDCQLGEVLITSTAIIVGPLTLVAGIHRLIRDRRSIEARYYTISCSILIIGMLIFFLLLFGIIPNIEVLYWTDKLMSAIHIMLLSFGMIVSFGQMKNIESDVVQSIDHLKVETKDQGENGGKSLEQQMLETKIELDKKNRLLLDALERVKMSDLRLREAEEKVKSADKVKDEFLANISHELRTPMQGILGFAKLGADRFNRVGGNKLLEYFSYIRSSGDKLLHLINNLLELSGLEKEAETYNFCKGALSTVTFSVLDEFASQLAEKNLSIKFNPPDFDDKATIDLKMIKKVIQNLLSNAIQYSNPGNEISINIELNSDSLQFSIYDQGVGVPDDELKTIFQKFVQSSRTKSNAGGTGLGLAICKKIIQHHNGRIWAESNPQGGTIFRFQIPKRQRDVA